ncbi:MAG: endonuclease III [Bacteroidales bacterium]|nr:endonuclease III [Bacteroidales bacterium]
MTRKQRFQKLIEYFKKNMPVAETELDYKDGFSLIVAVVLSAQCTDKRVNLITPELLKRFPSPEKMAESSIDEIYEYIKSCSYPNNKAKSLFGLSKMLVEDFNSEVPADIELLQKLPGVGRKTANVIVSVLYNMPAMAVDTHVFRVSARIGLTIGAKTPLETEKQLVEFFPEDLLHIAHHWLILHGRYVCKARKPLCEKCGLKDFCKSYPVTL